MQVDPSRLSSGERLLWQYGITQPDEIDLDAIALDLGIIVRRRSLDGADARLVAVGDRGIITVSTATHWKRQRFSIGHEIGHWKHDRNGDGMLACSKSDVSPKNQKAKTKEAEANIFSADLLLPPYIVRPYVGGRTPSVDLAIDVAAAFDTSLPATAIRLVRQSQVPVAVVVHSKSGKDWSFESLAWPSEFQLAREVHHDSPAMDLLYTGRAQAKTTNRKEPGSRWLWGKDAYRIDVQVQSIKRTDGQVLTMVQLCK